MNCTGSVRNAYIGKKIQNEPEKPKLIRPDVADVNTMSYYHPLINKGYNTLLTTTKTLFIYISPFF